MLDVEDLSVILSGRTLLRDITFAALPGRVTAIVGPNGSGKSTLLRALSGEVAYGGTAQLNGLDIARTPPRRMAALRAVLAQATQVAFPFTAEEIVRLGTEAGHGPADPGLPARMLAEVDLAGHGPRPWHLLSGGEAARVHLARILVQARSPVTPDGPGWMLLDEPVASLDIAHQLLVMRLCRRFAAAGGGVLMVVHDLNLTAMVADQVILLRSGALIADGPPDAVLTDATLQAAFGCAVRTNRPPAQGRWLLPQCVEQTAAVPA